MDKIKMTAMTKTNKDRQIYPNGARLFYQHNISSNSNLLRMLSEQNIRNASLGKQSN
jgi:hypothetical protein